MTLAAQIFIAAFIIGGLIYFANVGQPKMSEAEKEEANNDLRIL